MEEQGQAGLHRAPGAAEHRPGMDRGCGAQPQVGNAVDGKRTGEDHYETVSLAGIRSSTITTGRSCRPRRDGAGRLLTLDALHTTREADHRDPSRGLMVKGNAPSREHQLEDRQRYNEKPAHGRQRTIFTPLAKMIN